MKVNVLKVGIDRSISLFIYKRISLFPNVLEKESFKQYKNHVNVSLRSNRMHSLLV